MPKRLENMSFSTRSFQGFLKIKVVFLTPERLQSKRGVEACFRDEIRRSRMACRPGIILA